MRKGKIWKLKFRPFSLRFYILLAVNISLLSCTECIIECGGIVRRIRGELINSGTVNSWVYCERIPTRVIRYTQCRARTCVHASPGRLQQKRGGRRYTEGRLPNSNYVYPRQIPSSPYARMPMGRYHCLIKFEKYFFPNNACTPCSTEL